MLLLRAPVYSECQTLDQVVRLYREKETPDKGVWLATWLPWDSNNGTTVDMSTSDLSSNATDSPSHSTHGAGSSGTPTIPGSPNLGGRFVSPHIGSIDFGETL